MVSTAEATLTKNKSMVLELLKSIETGEMTPLAHLNQSQFVQHNPLAEDGVEGFIKVLEQLRKAPQPARVNTVRIFEDGDYVFAHSEYNFYGEKIGFDIFRFEDGLIVEHWDNLQIRPLQLNPSERSMIDGVTEADYSDRYHDNGAIVHQFILDVMMMQAPERLNHYFNYGHYIQHNPSIGDGLSGLQEALAWMAENDLKMEFHKIHKVLCDGDFVLSICEGTYGAEGGVATTYYDLFRLENGKIAEHWDVQEPIIPQSEWRNKNGKFGFR